MCRGRIDMANVTTVRNPLYQYAHSHIKYQTSYLILQQGNACSPGRIYRLMPLNQALIGILLEKYVGVECTPTYFSNNHITKY